MSDDDGNMDDGRSMETVMTLGRITHLRAVGDVYVLECLDEINRLKLEAQATAVEATAAGVVIARQAATASTIKEHRETIHRLQRDNVELASIREYLKELRVLHAACGQLAAMAMSIAPDGQPLHVLASMVGKKIATLGQK